MKKFLRGGGNRVNLRAGKNGISASGTPWTFAAFGLVALSVLAGGFWLWDKHKDKEYEREKHKNLKSEASDEADQEPAKEATSSQATTQTYEQMESTSICKDQGWIVDGMFPKGQISAFVAGADTGKTIAMVDVAIAASKGSVPTFLSQDSHPSEKVNVIYYRLEPRPGENEKRGYSSDLFEGTSWVQLEDLAAPTQASLIQHITAIASKATQDTLFLVDPLTKFSDFDAAKFYTAMKSLNVAASSKGLSHTFIVSVHADEKKPWALTTSEDVKGGDTLIQQFDAVFMLRKERRDGYRFIQALKPPKGCYDSSAVIVTKFATDGYTHHQFVERKPMTEALPLKPRATESETKVENPESVQNYTLSDQEVMEIIEKSRSRPGTTDKHNVTGGIQAFIREHQVKVAEGTVKNLFYARCKEMGISSKGEPRTD